MRTCTRSRDCQTCWSEEAAWLQFSMRATSTWLEASITLRSASRNVRGISSSQARMLSIREGRPMTTMNRWRSGRRSLTWRKLVKTPQPAPWQLTLSTCLVEHLTRTRRWARSNSTRLHRIAGSFCALASPGLSASWPLSSWRQPRFSFLVGQCAKTCQTSQ